MQQFEPLQTYANHSSGCTNNRHSIEIECHITLQAAFDEKSGHIYQTWNDQLCKKHMVGIQ